MPISFIMQIFTILLLLAIIVDASDTPTISGANWDEELVDDANRIQEDDRWNFSDNDYHSGSTQLQEWTSEDVQSSQYFDNFYDNAYENAWSLCIDSLWNTCVGRCGAVLSGAPYICGCDPICIAYGDCCMDYELECTFNGPYVNQSQYDVFSGMGHFTCIDLARDMKYGLLMVTECCDSWPDMANRTRELCESPSSDSYDPYQSRNGILYKNQYCAICNREGDAQEWQVQSICKPKLETKPFQTFRDLCKIDLDLSQASCAPYRVCSYDVNQCPQAPSDRFPAALQQVFSKFDSMCSAYSKPVFGYQLFGSMQMYKNVHCAHCNKVTTQSLYCPAWKLITTTRSGQVGSPIFFFETGSDATKRYKIKEIPATFAVLFYYGQDGNQQAMFSSQSEIWWDETLGTCNTNQIWDPFNEVCRDIYCSAEFTLVDFHCVDNYNTTVDYDSGQNISSSFIQSMDLTSVLVVMEIQMDCCIDSDINGILEDQFTNALAASLNVSSYRFVNFTIYNDTTTNGNETDQCQQETVVSMVLLGPDPTSKIPEPSIENIMALLSYSVSLNQLLLHLEAGITIRVYGIQEKVIQYTNQTANSTSDWCVDGHLWYYVNGEFTPMVQSSDPENYTLYIYVNLTGQVYLPGQFIANILFQGTQRSTVANVSGTVVVCDQSEPNNTCIRVLISHSDYVPLANGSILYVGNETSEKVFNPDSYEILANGDALVCITLPPPPNVTMQTFPNAKDIEVQSWLTTILLCCSTLAILITILTYAAFVELRNGPGWNMIHFTSCLFLYQVIYLAGMRPSVTANPIICKFVAINLHFMMLAFFLWSNVIAYDLYKAFGVDQLLPAKNRDTKRLPIYATYAYGVSLLIVLICATLDYLSIPGITIGYGEGEVCWIGDPEALLLFFVGPVALILIGNLILYINTVLSIRTIRRKTELTTGQSNSKNDLVVYMRISTVMGFTWVFGYLLSIPDMPYDIHDIFAYLFIIFNTLQGVLICLAFTFNKKVYNLYANCYLVTLFCSLLHISKCQECDKYVCACQKPVKRTISNETCQTVIADGNNDQPAANEYQ